MHMEFKNVGAPIWEKNGPYYISYNIVNFS